MISGIFTVSMKSLVHIVRAPLKIMKIIMTLTEKRITAKNVKIISH